MNFSGDTAIWYVLRMDREDDGPFSIWTGSRLEFISPCRVLSLFYSFRVSVCVYR